MSSRNSNSRISEEIVGQVAKYKYNGQWYSIKHNSKKKPKKQMCSGMWWNQLVMVTIQWKYYTAKKINVDRYLLTWNDVSSTLNEKVMHKTGGGYSKGEDGSQCSNSRSATHLLPNLEPQWLTLENGNDNSTCT